MPDSTAVQHELLELIDSLRRSGTFVRELSRQVREVEDAETVALARRFDRAAQLLDQAVRALRSPAEDERPAGAPRIPGLTGSTRSIPLSSVVSFLAEITASGVLRLYAQDESYVLQFDAGYLIYAFGDNPPEGLRLGEVLVAQGAIERADLLRVLDEGWEAGETLGGLLVREGYVESEQLEAALETQIQELGKRLFSHEDARFRFYPDERIVDSEDVRMNVMGLLLETARVRDEARHGLAEEEIDHALLDLDVA